MVDALFRCSLQRVLECNLIQINKTDWVYPLGLAMSPSEPLAILKMQKLVLRPNLPRKLFLWFTV